MLQSAGEDEVQHRVFELAASGSVTGGEDLRELGHAAAWAEAVEGAGELADRDERALRLADRAAEGAVLERGREVDEGPGGGRHRDAVMARDVVNVED